MNIERNEKKETENICNHYEKQKVNVPVKGLYKIRKTLRS